MAQRYYIRWGQGLEYHRWENENHPRNNVAILTDNPTAYKAEQESVDFITSVPTVFDETVPLE